MQLFIGKLFILFTCYFRNDLVVQQFIVELIGLFNESTVMLFDGFFPNECKLIRIGFDLCTVNKNSLLINEPFFNELTTKLNKALTDEVFHFRMNTKTINGAVARLIPLG